MKQLSGNPQRPSGAGSFDWRSVGAFLLVIFLANVTATQDVANHFHYQRALGTPLLRIGFFALYQPFHWIIWTLHYVTSSNPAISRPVLTGLMLAVAGFVLAMGVYALLSLRRTKALSKLNEDIHGSARWATPEEIRESGIMNAGKGVYIGGWFDEKKSYLHYLQHDGPEHILAFAPTRSGKGVGLVIPTLLAWEDSVIVYDIKGENWAKTSGFRASAGQVCFKFSPLEEDSSSFNPLGEIRINTPRDVSDAQNLAEMLVNTGEDSPNDRYWRDAAASLLTGMILHTCYAAQAEGREPTLAGLANVFTTPGQGFRDTLTELLEYSHDTDYKQGWVTTQGIPSETHPVVREKVQEMLDKEEKEFSGVLSFAKVGLTLFSDPLVARNTSTSDFRCADFLNADKPLSVYMVVPPSDKLRLRPLLRLIITMLVNRLTEKMEFKGTAQAKPKHRLLFMIDEFPSLNKMAVLADALSYMAGYGLKAYLITQDIRQLLEQYGEHESIMSNCHVRIAYAPNQYETAELLSKMAGNRTVKQASFNYSGSRFSIFMKQTSASTEYVERPLVTPDEVMRLKPAQKKKVGDHERIEQPGEMLVFQAGRRPIFGSQILYFADPELSQRASIPPPTELFRIENGQAYPRQKLPAKTNKPFADLLPEVQADQDLTSDQSLPHEEPDEQGEPVLAVDEIGEQA
jgi:type IV secretion system protein VirD4